MKKELLSPENLETSIQQRIDELQTTLSKLERRVKITIPGRLRILNVKNKTRYYHVKTNDKPQGEYIAKKDIDIAFQLAQKQYNKEIEKAIKNQIDLLQNSLQKLQQSNIEHIYSSLNINRQKLITPVTLTNEQIIDEWNKQDSLKTNTFPITTEFFTENNIHVRSKSELLIANELEKLKIPFHYEYPLKLSSNICYPDFTCFNLRTRKVFYWEHFGMMDNNEYVQKTIQKLHLYQENNILPGKNFIITFENQTIPLSTKSIMKIIKTYLL